MTQGAVQVVLFDFDGTLRHSLPSPVQAFHRLSAELGVEADASRQRAAERWTHAYWADSDELREDIRVAGGEREIIRRLYVRRHLQALGVEETRLDDLSEALFQRLSEAYQPEDHVPDDVLPTLDRLKKNGFRLGLLSNRGDTLWESLDSNGLAGAFELALAAGELGWWKPDPRAFLTAAERMAVQPERVMYVGDNYYADVQGARAAGMQPVLMDPQGLFPEAGCPIIGTIGELPGLLADGG